MRIVCGFLWIILFCNSYLDAVPMNSSRINTSSSSRGGIATQVVPKKNYTSRSRGNIGVKVVPPPNVEKQKYLPNYQVSSAPSRQAPVSRPQDLKVDVIPPVHYPQQTYTPPLDVRVYPPTLQVGRNNANKIYVEVGKSQPITNDMMFEKTTAYKKKLPPRKELLPPPPPPPPPAQVDEYEDDEVEPLFVRNRNGVLLGFGIGGNFDRLWLSNGVNNLRIYENNFTYYFRLGYQHYFTEYLGLRGYAHLGDWSSQFSRTIFDGQRDAVLNASGNVNYNFFAEILYDFWVISNHSLGLFGGVGFGIGAYELSNDGVDRKKDIFTIPMFSAGFAYTLYENNRFEFEIKTPLRQPVIDLSWRGEFSTWMIGFSYTYIF